MSAKKRLSLADRIAQQSIDNTPPENFEVEKKSLQKLAQAKDEHNNLASKQANKLTSKQTTKQLPKQLPKQVDNTASKQLPKQIDNSTGKQVDNTASEQIKNSASEQTSGQVDRLTNEQVDNSASGQDTILFDLSKKPKDLNPKQYRVLYEIYFNRPFKVHGPERIGGSKNFKIPYGTVRYCLESLYKKGYISKPFSINNGIQKGTSCQVNEGKCIQFFGPTLVINSEQVNKSTTWQTSGQVDRLTNEQVDNSTSGQVSKIANEQAQSSNKKERSLLNNLSFYLENSAYWKGQGLTLKKCEGWIEKLDHCEPDFLLTQLRFAENSKNVRNSDKPLNYFFTCLADGGLPRPPDFLLPQEKATRIKKAEIEAQLKAAEEMEVLREKERAIAEKLAFLKFLENSEIVAELIKKIESRYTTNKLKISIQVFKDSGNIDPRLENALKLEFQNLEDD
ncbi:hypothetical protein [Desulfospira joergensenii]|uniref:hypothetical protein n=1 Tax=Desulfospira joergensenii TaxID=53329 RepID=UPI0003B3AC39|nr:hypothetical protein [Desulfospira joergensenii]